MKLTAVVLLPPGLAFGNHSPLVSIVPAERANEFGDAVRGDVAAMLAKPAIARRVDVSTAPFVDDFALLQQSEMVAANKITSVMQRLFESGYRYVVAMDSDCIALDATYLEASLEALSHSNVVLSPDDKGGCALVGIAPVALPVVAEVDMSKGRAMAEMQAVADDMDLTSTALPVRPRFDSYDKLQSAFGDGTLNHAVRTLAALRSELARG